jgi:AcrR family transcriptional regulator
LLERAYRYALEHGVADLSLRPLSAAIQSSPRVLLFLFGSKAQLVQALLSRAREDELALLERVRSSSDSTNLPELAAELWQWLAADEHRALLMLWVEGYTRSLIDPEGPWAGFARATVEDWLDVLAHSHASHAESRPIEETEQTLVLAILRGCLLDLLATGDLQRTTNAVQRQLATLGSVRLEPDQRPSTAVSPQ